MNLRATGTVVVVALLLIGGILAWVARSAREGTTRAPASLEELSVHGRVPAFELTERSGRAVGLDELRGRVWVVDFIYTECTESCPTQSRELARLQEEFAAAADFRLVSITVDPEHDRPAVLREYAERYGATARWLFLTGTKRDIYCLAREGFKLSVSDPAGGDPTDCGRARRLGPGPAWAGHGSGGLILHSARVALVDRNARIRAYHLATDPASLTRLRANVRRLLGQPDREARR